MPVRREGQLEKCVDEAIRKHDFHALQQFQQTDFSDDMSHKCSKQFLNKLDKLICQQLDSEDVNNVSTLLNTLQNHGRNINILGEVGFPAMIEYGLIQKMVNWFEKAKEILGKKDRECNEAFTTLFEDFFDVLMIVHDTSSEGKIQTLENFILRISALVADKRISIYIQQEAVRKLNTMLIAMPRDIRKKTISTKEMLQVMNDMGKRILDAGDYDLQVAITEALCRMTSEKQRRELAIQWFPMDFVSSAFKQIKDSEFETDCRKFLNQVNGMLGDKRRVFTYPCLSAALGKHELQMPADENLEECWIDFNVGSKSISFYVAADDEGQQWETVCIPEEDVKTYIIEEKEKEKLLMVHLNNPMSVGAQEGGKIILHFDSALEITDAVRKVYDATKCQSFPRKNTGSVAKTTVHVVFDESGSQVLIPESQISPLKEKECKLQEEKYSFSFQHQYPQAEINLSKKTIEMDFQTGQSKATPGKRKMSEASMIVSSTSRFSVQSPFPSISTSTPRKGKIRTPLQMMGLVERNEVFSVPETRAMKAGREDNCAPLLSATKALNRNNSVEKQIPAEKRKNMIHSEEELHINGKQKLDELSDIVPDSQPPIFKSDKSLLPGLSNNFVAEIKTQKKTKCWIPETIITQCQKITASESIVYQAANLSDRAAKQRAFASIFEMTSSEIRKKQHCSGKLIEEQHSKTNKIPDSQTNFKHLDEKIPKSKSRKSVSNTSEISLPATKKNNSSLITSRHSKSTSEMNDHDIRLNISPPAKETASKKTDQINYEKKTKSKDVIEAAEMLISKISKRYKEKDGIKNTAKLCQSFSDRSTSLNKTDSDDKKKRQNRRTGNFRTTLHNNTNEQSVDDVYDFNQSGFDEPTIKLGVQELHLINLETTGVLPKKMTQKNETTSITQKKQEKKGRTNRNYKHLFSDTDTEYRGDDTNTDISWLRESNRKPKPQLVNYGRARIPRKSKTLKPDKFSISPGMREISPPPKSRSNKNDNGDGERTLQTRSKKLRKAALAKKCYKELSSSEIESEEEISEYLNEKNTSNEHPEHKITAKSRAVNQSKIQQHTIASETVRGKLINQSKRSTKAKDDMIKKQMELPSSPSSGSPPFSEIMRCYEKHTEESAEEHISVRRSSLSSYLEELTPEKEKSLENIKEDFTMGKINSESELLKDLPEKGRKLVFEAEDLSPVISPLSLSNVSPFSRKKPFINYNNSEIAKDKICDTDEAVSITSGLLNKSFHTEIEDISENIMNIRREASLPPSQLTTPCRSREELEHEECLTNVHESGPIIHPNFKRLYQEDTENYSDEEEIRREERKIKLLPRKLFKADDSTYRVSESLSTFSINETSVFDGEGWDADCSNVEMICQTLHKEYARKIQSRSKKIDCFAKQSLKTTHQHMNTMGRELHKHRSRQLENLHSCLLKELESFERDSQILRNIEKDFSNFSKKHFETFSTYNKNEQQRLQNLRTSFEKNIYHTADQEENIFLSQVHFLKEDIDGIQNKFLKEMHEEELLNVRKGLQSLFMAEDRKL
ncbi:synaptonemal complex protein 2 [Pituophis catenifer annectens]|uniref:synaptonemal complex protein 2 n=1 Tax=Pituophis catenifer annectens TaxID=94852 RepID=UPI003996A80B